MEWTIQENWKFGRHGGFYQRSRLSASRDREKKLNVFEITSAWVLIVTSLYTNFFNFSAIKMNTSIDLFMGRKRFRLSMVCILLRKELVF